MGALQRFMEQREDLYAGRVPSEHRDGLRVGDLCNEFLNDRRHRQDAGEITKRTWGDYHASCGRVVKCFGRNRLVDDLRAEDFLKLRRELSKNWGPVALGNEVSRIRVIFNFAYQSHLLDRPVRFGPSFKRPSQRVLRNARAERGPKRFSAEEIHKLLGVASVQMRAMILLGINCGLGNGDVARLEFRHIDLESKWLDYPRPKSGVERTSPLWPETCDALREAIENRSEPLNESDANLVFITKYGKSWFKESSDNPIANEFRKLLHVTKIYRKGVGFYALRHTFETEGGNTGDQVAVNHIMGHAPSGSDMSAIYREGVSGERLSKITDHVRSWLYDGEEPGLSTCAE
ncbi:MAG: site-specific integrase [Pirellulaceae bacterium]